MGLDIGAVPGGVVVVDPLLAGEQGIEAFRVEVAIVHVVAPSAQAVENAPVQGCNETRLDRMGVEHKRAHHLAAADRPGNR